MAKQQLISLRLRVMGGGRLHVFWHSRQIKCLAVPRPFFFLFVPKIVWILHHSFFFEQLSLSLSLSLLKLRRTKKEGKFVVGELTELKSS